MPRRLAGREWLGRVDAEDRLPAGQDAVGATLPILPDLAEALARVPRDRLLFLTHGARHLPYNPETLGNW